MPPPYFTPETLKFLRGLTRHNDREWFEPRRDIYERALRAPLLELIETVNQGLASFAPGHVRPPARTAMRIYRDTRFSPDKRPYKRHVGAWWAERETERTTGAGFYVHLSATEVIFAAGVFMPSTAQLLAVRTWLAENHQGYGLIVRNILKTHAEPALAEADPESLRRVPRGFAADHPAADLLRSKRWGVHLALPAEAALRPDFAEVLISRFRVASPLVLALAGAIRDARRSSGESADPLLARPGMA